MASTEAETDPRRYFAHIAAERGRVAEAEPVCLYHLGIEASPPSPLTVVAEADRRARQPAQERGTVAVGQIHDKVKFPVPKLPHEAPLAGYAPAFHYQDLIEGRVIPNHLIGAGIHKHSDVGLWEAFSQSAQHRSCQQDIPHIPQLNDQYPIGDFHSRQVCAAPLSRARSASTISWTSSLNFTW